MKQSPIRCFAPRETLAPRMEALAARFREFIEGGVYIDGDWVEKFESAVSSRVGMPHAVGCCSGTAALTLAMKACGIGRGDTVITVANTYYATARAIVDAGAAPIFVDIDPATGQMDPRLAADAILNTTKAILPVHLYGYPAPSAELRKIADARGLALIEDCAHAFGAGRADAAYGSAADFACFSFYPTKTLGAVGDAGLVCARDASAADAIRRFRYFSDADRLKFDRNAIHAKLDAFQAAILLVLLSDVDALVAERRRHAAFYRAALGSNVHLYSDADDASPYVFAMRIPDRARFIETMQKENIFPGIHYSTQLHQFDEFGGAREGTLPLAESHNREIVSLPVYPGLGAANATRVADAAARSLILLT
ncbi:MAG: DegT/DnrJ/EryC1/StrS family aminotransferase [Planctomycetes bacterium]|nr:DegT/DnrJ/EryC1/StrS family aminotransferase [Planctomycetota bacterium]